MSRTAARAKIRRRARARRRGQLRGGPGAPPKANDLRELHYHRQVGPTLTPRQRKRLRQKMASGR